MPTPDTSGVPIFADFEMLKAKLNEIVQKYNNLLVSLDSLNVVSLTADHIDSGTINAGVVTIRGADGSVYYQFDQTGIVAFNGSENTLEFDLATGLLKLVQVLIQTASGYPRVEINPAGNIFKVYTNANSYLLIEPGITNAPNITFYESGSFVAAIGTGFGSMNVQSDSTINVGSNNGNLNLSCGTGVLDTIRVPSWDRFSSIGDGETLQDALDSKQNTISGYTGSVNVVTGVNFTAETVTTDTLHFTNGILTSVT